MREQMGFLEQSFRITEKNRELLLSVSPSTADRLLKADKKKLAVKGKSGTRPEKLLKKQILVRTYYANADKKPGFFEIDTVHHCGTSDSEEFCLTLTATNVYSGWTELRPTLNKTNKWVFQAMLDIKSSLPFPLMGIDSDNSGETPRRFHHLCCLAIFSFFYDATDPLKVSIREIHQKVAFLVLTFHSFFCNLRK
jgi:hypothetical protein